MPVRQTAILVICKHSALVLALAACGGWTSPADAQDGISQTVQIVTQPAADICELVKSELTCLARSPARLRLEFRNAASARRLHVVRIGYETARIIVRPGEPEVRVALRERSIYAVSRPDAASEGKQVRDFVNQRLRELFFGAMPPEGLRGFEFLGAVDVAPAGRGRFEVIVPVMIEDQFRIKQLAAIERRFPRDERPARLALSLWESYVAPLGGALRNAFAQEERIAKVTVAANYSRTRYTLVDDDATFMSSRTTWTHSTTRSYGDVVQRVDHYQTTTFRLPTGYTKLSATKRVYVAAFVIPSAGRQGYVAPKSRPAALTLEEVAVLSNDNRSGELVEVSKPR
jgi:hypothetical protein